MTKKNNKNNNGKNSVNKHHRHMDVPEVVNIDTLAYVNDDELDRRLDFLNSERDKASGYGIDLYPWEIEIAYVQREMKIRNARRAAHERFMKSNPDFYVVEDVAHDRDIRSTQLN